MKESTIRYQVFGKYYTLNGLLFRRLLVIGSIKRNKKSDALVVMMNPGGSKPKNNLYKDVLAEAKPDRTHYKIMRLMDEYKWKKVAVINLSDYIEKKSGRFNSKLKELQKSHSIFDSSRKNELKAICKSLKLKAPIILAWGVAKETSELREIAYQFFTEQDYHPIGYSYGNDAYCFVHPLAYKFNHENFRNGGFDWTNELTKLL